MTRAVAALVLVFGLAGGLPALADASSGLSPADEIIRTLEDRGYRIVQDERTWLGRQRIIAEKDNARRELVFIPGTGEILRDYSVRLATGGDAPQSAPTVAMGDENPGLTVGTGAPATESAPALSVGETVGLGSVAPEALTRGVED